MSKFSRIFVSAIFVIVLVILSGCGTGSSVTRVSADTQTDLSGRWNDTDAKLVAEGMISDVLSRTWRDDFLQETGEKPKLIVGRIRLKDATEHIKTNGFVKDMERELINSGMVRFVASSEERKEVRAERLDQQSFASESTAKRLANEKGADFMLQGSITMYVDAVDGQQVKFYQVDLELLDLESSEKVWMGSKKIKKSVERQKTSW
ncbi:MAG: penicillin-binding protein activator LpoB [Candidatus Marinimicrobia bacterium]|nr:penicillin-binding protein activator LpoB [Candidatus Neomarinimicrobiota bacterium]